MSRPGIEPVTSRSPERTLYQLSYWGRFDVAKESFAKCFPHECLSACTDFDETFANTYPDHVANYE